MKPPLIEWVRFSGHGPHLAKWLAWARNHARWLYQSGVAASKHAKMADGTDIDIEIRDGQAFIRVTGGAVGSYQFMGSLARLFKTFRDPSYPDGINRMLPLGYAVLVTLAGGKPKATALFSSAEPPGERYWPYNADPRLANLALRLSPAHQPDGMGVYQGYGPTTATPRRNVPYLLTQWQQALPCSGLGWYGSGSASRFTTLDMAYDLGPTLFSTDPLQGVQKAPHSDWYGRAAWRTVEDVQWGSRTFLIMVDVNSVFYCYPTEGYGSTPLWTGWPGENGNVPAALTQSQSCPWPSWVTTEPLGVAAITAGVSDAVHRGRLRPLWAFNHAGTRAACIMAHRAANWADSYFASSYYDDTGALDTTYQEDIPGLIEVAFAITLTGPRLEDFTFSVTLRQQRYAGDLGVRAPVAVGYALRAMGDIPLDALLLLEYQHLVDNPSLCTGPAGSISGTWRYGIDPDLYNLRRPNKATVAWVQWQGPTQASGWSVARRWLAYYACYPNVGEPRLFYPKIEDFAAHTGQTPHANFFRYIANIVALEMEALAFCLGASLWTLGDFQIAAGTWQTDGAHAACIKTIAFNQDTDRQMIGHPELTPVASQMLDLVGAYPDLSAMTEVYPAATLDQTGYDPSAWETPDPLITATRYATLTVRDGAGQSWTRLVQGASENLMGYSNLPNIPAFAGASHLWGPAVFTLWDGLPNVRPGLRWAISGTLQPGSITFAGYPYGAIHHNSVLFLTTTALNNVGARFSVHRCGSWALFAGPFAARTDLSPWWQNGAPLPAPPLAYQQTLMDRIMLRDERTQKDVATTHIEMLNAAFDKRLKPEDFYFDLRYSASTGAEFRPASDDPTAHGWYPVTRLAPLGVIWSHQSLQANRGYDEFCFDPAFVTRKPHIAYNSFTTFPTPRQEGVFLPPGA